MAVITSRATATRPGDGTALVVDWTGPLVRTVMEAQFAQWNALMAWHRSLAAFNKDLWEQWACRFAGVPIDV